MSETEMKEKLKTEPDKNPEKMELDDDMLEQVNGGNFLDVLEKTGKAILKTI